MSNDNPIVPPASEGGPPRADAGGPETVLREARQRFIAGFPKRCDSLDTLLKAVAARGPRGLTAPLREIAHQVAGMAGTVGFPTLSDRAAELELLATNTEYGFDLPAARALVTSLHDAFASDMAAPPAWATGVTAPAPGGVRILIVDDAPEQREMLGGLLQAAGYETIPVEGGDAALKAARDHHPALVLLDVNMPGLDGYAVCRMLKSDAELAGVPVIFSTVRSGLDDRLAGLTLGADDYLVKPIHSAELLLRIDLVLRRTRAARPGPNLSEGRQGQLLSYDVFVRVAREQLRASPASFALVRIPEEDAAEIIAMLRNSIRARDIVSRYDQNHVVMLLAGAPAALLRHRVADHIEALKARGIRGVWAGIAATTRPNEKPVEALLADADDALAEARYLGEAAAVKSDRPRTGPPAGVTTLLLAEDDPEVVRIVETQFMSAGYRVDVAHDGAEALAALPTSRPDVIILDLVMPNVSGFEVLERLGTAETRPRIVVLSVRGREEDVTRAFELGADDYVTKPFSPRELMARVARLLR